MSSRQENNRQKSQGNLVYDTGYLIPLENQCVLKIIWEPTAALMVQLR